MLALAKAAGINVRQHFGAESFYDYLRLRWEKIAPWEEAMKQGGHWNEAVPAPALQLSSEVDKLTFAPPKDPESRAQ